VELSYGSGKFFSATGPPENTPRPARRITIGVELSSKIAANAASFVIRKSRMLGLPVAKLTASREKSSRSESSKLASWGSNC